MHYAKHSILDILHLNENFMFSVGLSVLKLIVNERTINLIKLLQVSKDLYLNPYF